MVQLQELLNRSNHLLVDFTCGPGLGQTGSFLDVST